MARERLEFIKTEDHEPCPPEFDTHLQTALLLSLLDQKLLTQSQFEACEEQIKRYGV